MAEYIFGSGTVIAKRTDIANTPPALLGVLQDITVDFSRTIEDLVGQYAAASAFGGGPLKITGKAKFGRFNSTQFNNLLFGGTLTPSSGLEMVDTGESVTVSSAAATVANGATFVEDMGVFTTAGVQLQPVVSAPVSGVSYVPGAPGVGTYTFNASDNGVSYLVYYTYTVANENKIVLANPLMGSIPNFKVTIKENFTVFGVKKNLLIQFNNCVSEKLALAFNNSKFTIPEFDFRAGADSANNILTISMTE